MGAVTAVNSKLLLHARVAAKVMSFAAKVAALRALITVPDDVPLPPHGATPCRDIETGGTSQRFGRLVWS